MTYLLMGNSMKDFYKILGVKKNASEQEIRARWIELTKHHHPDRVEDPASDEKIREINEAYQTLKHSSTRVEYDLKRTYGRKERGPYLKKLVVPVSILAILMIIGIVYIKNYQSPRVSELTVSNPIDQINEINQRDLSPLPGKLNKKVLPYSESVRDEMQSLFHRDSSTQQPKLAKAAPAVLIKQEPTHPINELNPTNQLNETNPTNEINPTNPINPVDQENQGDAKVELVQLKPPSLLATEDEVKKFFDHYIAYYHRMDLESFLSLFSSKAIQNKKDGLEGIRKIYHDFFTQSKEFHYALQDMKIETYQNAVEVKARYQIEQISKKSEGRMVWKGQIQWVLIKENGALKILSLDYQHQ